MTTDVIVAGHICLDVIPTFPVLQGERAAEQPLDRLFRPGSLVQVGPAIMSTGGPVSNTGLALHKLGLRTRLMGKVGEDVFGTAIVDLVRSIDVDLAQGMTRVPGEQSSYTIVINPPGVDRFFLHCPGANDTFGAADVDYEQLASAKIFHFGYPPIMRRMYTRQGTELVELLRRAHETGATTSLDMAMIDPASPAGQANWPAIIQTALPYVDVFLPSIEEILLMLRPAVYAELMETGDLLASLRPELLTDVSEQLLAMGAAIVGLKVGHLGLYLRTADAGRLKRAGRGRPQSVEVWARRELWAPCFQVEVVGTTGAGDATIAGFLAALLHSLDPTAAATMAVAVGACNVEAADAVSGVRTWEETQQRVQSGWARHALSIEASGWQWDDAGQVWVGPA